MKLSTRTTYGLRTLLSLTKASKERPLSIASIAQEEDLSSAYLERIVSQLKKNGLVEAGKGSAGGYWLARPANMISVWDVISSLDKSTNVFQCTKKSSDGSCGPDCSCRADLALLTIENSLKRLLSDMDLQKLAKIKHEASNNH
jgi:Rrf2 family iron-sulfur cluster assembly transcriptional regulator